ncbi:LysR substrate-binding domain-containing protein [Uliginosibacterium sp. 31-16]|uniref:LysR family transcriptional regulator n=1 Tax=Uliginosibacterium sp. 31-16 TaxID=3068315 RepID=UPI00273F5FC6|nr:LysR substrate-binding domain-containing protein [Uliginosibacterium sp. 31-16]MDP5239252.1 LysR substrate-binding domain-containing protein [Uliginosibacterium sp. 31-16]
MDFRHFRYFVTVAEELHVARAAAQLGMAQPALSQHIRALEDRLGVQLFLRANRRISLTEAGEAFLAEAREALRHAELATNAAQRAARGESGNVVVGYVSSALAEPAFVAALAAFRSSHPEVVIEMRMRLVAVHIEALRAQAVDLTVTRGPMPDIPEGYESFVLAHQPIVVAVPQAHALSAASAIALPELSEDTFLQPEDPPGTGLADTVSRLCAAARFVPRRSMVVNEMASVVGLVAAGLGVALLPASATYMQIPGVVYRPLQDGTATSDLLVIHRRFERSPAVRALLTRLRADAIDLP